MTRSNIAQSFVPNTQSEIMKKGDGSMPHPVIHFFIPAILVLQYGVHPLTTGNWIVALTCGLVALSIMVAYLFYHVFFILGRQS